MKRLHFLSALRGIFSNFAIVTLALAAMVFNTSAPAQIATLQDANSTVSINNSSQTGMYSWAVDGQNQLSQQWFWYRVGSSGPQASIDTLGAPSISQPANNFLTTTYSGSPSFSLQVVYSLVGGSPGSGTSDLSEQIKIQNLTGAPLDFHFFQYADFVAGPGGDQVQLGKNLHGLYNQALVTSGNMTINEKLDTALSPGANEGEAAGYNSTLLNLNNVPGYTLNDNNVSGPPGTNTWSFEWDKSIAPGGSLIISKDLNISGVAPVPEPGTLSIAGLGLAAVGVARAYRRRRS